MRRVPYRRANWAARQAPHEAPPPTSPPAENTISIVKPYLRSQQTAELGLESAPGELGGRPVKERLDLNHFPGFATSFRRRSTAQPEIPQFKAKAMSADALDNPIQAPMK